jgi:hypothetical protein
MSAPKSGNRSITLNMTNKPIAQKIATAARSEFLAAESQDRSANFLECNSDKVDMEETPPKLEAARDTSLSDFFAAGCDRGHRLAFSGAVYMEGGYQTAKPLESGETDGFALSPYTRPRWGLSNPR